MKNKLLYYIGKACKDIRKRQGIAQVDVAKVLHIDPSCLSRFESGQINNLTYLQWYVNKANTSELNYILEVFKYETR